MDAIPLIWIIDDDEVFSFGFRKIIIIRNIAEEVRVFQEAGKAISALKLALANSYPLPKAIFLDLYLPDMDGWGFAEKFQHLDIELFGKIPVFLMTSSLDEGNKEKALLFPAITTTISKPIFPAKIPELIALHVTK